MKKYISVIIAVLILLSASPGDGHSGTWSLMDSGAAVNLQDIWGTSDNDVFAVGAGNLILHYDGVGWNQMSDGTNGRYIEGVWGNSWSDVYAVGSDGVIKHYDGVDWSRMSSGTNWYLRGVWGSSLNDVFAVGSGGTILHYDGGAWSLMQSGTYTNLFDVWGGSGSDIFAVGLYGTILRYDGVEWSQMPNGTMNHLFDVWGGSGSDIFAVGSGGTILHYDGVEWRPMNSGTTNNLLGVWGSSGSNVFAVGLYGTILRYDGVEWSRMTSGTMNHLFGIWGCFDNEVFAVGANGTILHYNEGSTAAVSTYDAGNLTPDSARLNGFLDSTGSASTINVSFQWGMISGIYNYETSPQPVSESGPFSFDLINLDSDATYYFRAKAEGNEIVYGDEKGFTTPVLAVVDVKPETLNISNRRGRSRITAYIELNEDYDVRKIDATTVTMEVNGAVIEALDCPISIGDHDGDAVPDLMVKFRRMAVVEALAGLTGNVELVVSGRLFDERVLNGRDTIRVIRPRKRKAKN